MDSPHPQRHLFFQLTLLPAELLFEILQYVDETHQPTLASLRLVNSRLELIARFFVFRRVRLSGRPNYKAEINFFNIARSARLSPCVREVCVNSWGPYEPFQNDNFKPPIMFMSVLPYLQYFPGVTEIIVHLAHNNFTKINQDVRNDYSCWILNVILKCIAGTWSRAEQKSVDQTLDFRGVVPVYGKRLEKKLKMPLPIQKFDVSLMDMPIDSRVVDSQAFLDLCKSPTLREARMSMAEDYFQNNMVVQDLHIDLHKTWLSNNLGLHLRQLCLYWRGPADDSFPPLSIADNWKTADPAFSFPALKELILGRYAFTSWEQVDWITNVGKGNGGQGLEELRLDDCRIFYQDLPEATQERAAALAPEDEPQIYDQCRHPLRWYKVIAHWMTRMPKLRTVQMSSGTCSHFPVPFSEDMYPWIALLARTYEDDSARPEPKTFEDFNIPEPHSKAYEAYHMWFLPPPNWDSSRYCSARQVAFGGRRSVVTDFERFKNPYADLPSPLPWYTEKFLKDLDGAALAFMHRLIEERHFPGLEPIMHALLAGVAPSEYKCSWISAST